MRTTCGQCAAAYIVEDSYCDRSKLKASCPVCGCVKEINNNQATLQPVVAEDCKSEDVPEKQQEKVVETKKEESENEAIWKVKKADGLEIGPLTLAEVREKIRCCEIDRKEFLAKGDSEFLTIEHWAGLEPFSFKTMSTSAASKVRKNNSKNATRSKSKVQIYLVLALLVSIAAVVGSILFIPPKHGAKQKTSNVIEIIIAEFAKEVQSPVGTVEEQVKVGFELMWLDSSDGYLQADKAFKTAMVLDHKNYAAWAGWVQNRALMDIGKGNVRARKTAMDMIDYALHNMPDNSLFHRAKAYLMFSLGDLIEARKSAEKAIHKNPKDPETQLISGISWLDSKTDMAVPLIQQAIEGKPRLQLAYRLLAQAHARQGRFNVALKVFKDVLKQQPGHLVTMESLAGIALEVGDFKLAEKTYKQILDIDGLHVSSLVHLARINTQIFKRHKNAISMIEKALTKAKHLSTSDRAKLLGELSVSYRVAGSVKKALKTATQAVHEDTYCATARYAQAVVEQEAEQVVVALSHFKELKNYLPHSARVWARIAELYMLVPDFDKAQQEFSHAIRIDGNDIDIYLMRAVMHILLDNKPKALSWMQKALAIDSLTQNSNQDLQEYYDGPAFLRYAIDRAKQAAVKYDEDAFVQSLLGIVYYRARQPKMAVRYFTRALQIKADCFQANLFLGLLNISAGRYSKAVSFLEAARKKDVSHAIAIKSLAQAYLKKGQAKKAEVVLKKLIDFKPKDAGAQIILAEVLLFKKQKKHAIERLVKLVREDNNLMAKRMLFQMGY